METGKEVTTTPEDFMKHIAEDIKKYQEFQNCLLYTSPSPRDRG